MANPKVIDLDLDLNEVEAPTHTKQVKILGREWTITCDVNVFAVSRIASGEAMGIASFVTNMVVPEQRDEFADLLSNAPGMSADRLTILLSRLIEVAGERPTEPPSPSLRTAKSQRSPRKSAAN
jgi:hypothetical protein